MYGHYREKGVEKGRESRNQGSRGKKREEKKREPGHCETLDPRLVKREMKSPTTLAFLGGMRDVVGRGGEAVLWKVTPDLFGDLLFDPFELDSQPAARGLLSMFVAAWCGETYMSPPETGRFKSTAAAAAAAGERVERAKGLLKRLLTTASEATKEGSEGGEAEG